MRNIHVIPTDKPSRIYLIKSNNKLGITSNNPEFTENFGSGTQNQNIYITSDEEIKVNDYVLDDEQEVFQVLEINHTQGILRSDGFTYVIDVCQKIILSTDTKLINDGIQPINDEFLEWFIKNSSCEEVKIVDGYQMFSNKNAVKIYKIIIPKEESKQFVECKCTNALQAENCIRNCGHGEEPKQETFNSNRGLKEVQLKDPNTCENYKEVGCLKDVCDCYTLVAKQETLEEFIIREGYPIGSQQEIWEDGVRNGAKWQKEQDKNKYSEEDIEEYAEYCTTHVLTTQIGNPYLSIKDWFEQIKKK